MLALWFSGITAGFVMTLLNFEGTLSGALYIADMVISIICVALWCQFDAAARHARFTSSDIVWIVVFGIIGIPRYFLRTRRGKQLLFTLFGLYLYIYSILATMVGGFSGGVALALLGIEID